MRRLRHREGSHIPNSELKTDPRCFTFQTMIIYFLPEAVPKLTQYT